MISDYFNQSLSQVREIKDAFEIFRDKSEKDSIRITILNEKITQLQLDFNIIDKTIIEYPYLKNFFLPKIIAIDSELSKSTTKINRYYFLFLILSKQNELYLSIQKCYQKLIETNLFNIPYSISSFLTPETVKSNGFKRLTFGSGNWHTKSELIIFYLSLLNYYYDMNLNFNFCSTSMDKNIDNSIKIFSKQNILKLGGYICRKLTDESGLDGINQNKLILFFSTALSFGINLESMFQFSVIPFIRIIVKYYLNNQLGKSIIYCFLM